MEGEPLQPTRSEAGVPVRHEERPRLHPRPRAHPLRRTGARRRPPAGRAGPDDRHQHHSPARGPAPPQAGGPGRARRPPGRPGRDHWTRPRPATCWSCGSSLDPLAASLAAERRTEADLAEIARGARRTRGAASTRPSTAQLESHHRFHAAIHRASHNALLVEALDGLWVKTDRYRGTALEAGRSDEERDARADRAPAAVRGRPGRRRRDRGRADAPARGDQPRRTVGRPAGRPDDRPRREPVTRALGRPADGACSRSCCCTPR